MDYEYFAKILRTLNDFFLPLPSEPAYHAGHHDCVNDSHAEEWYNAFWNMWTSTIPESEEREMDERAQS